MDPQQLYHDSIIIDGLNVSNWNSPGVFDNLRTGNITAISATVATWENFLQTMDHLSSWTRRFQHRSDIHQIHTVADILAAKKADKTGIILSFQNASPVENDLERFALFHAIGVRIIQLTYHERNLLGNGCFERRDEGLSNFGIDAVRTMNELGILIDLSHVGDRTTLETIEVSEKPVAITHANARSYYDHPRNKADDVLKLLTEKGGVVGTTPFCNFLPTRFESTLDDYIDAVDDMIDRVGIEHVAVGTDSTHDQPLSFWHYISAQQGTKYPSTFSPTDLDYLELSFQPKGLSNPAEFPNLASALDRRGYSPTDIVKILGGNWMRLFREVWQA